MRKAKCAYQAGRFTQPNGKNVSSDYQQVIKIDPGNARAKLATEEIIDYYKKHYDTALNDRDFQKAETTMNVLD